MALKATIYKAELNVADMDRHVYDDFSLTIARHPSETDERIPVAALPLGRGRIESVLRFSTHLESESEVEIYAQASRLV